MNNLRFFTLLILLNMFVLSDRSVAQIVPDRKSLPAEIQQELKAAGQFCEPNITYRFAVGTEGRIYAIDYNAMNCKSFCTNDGCRLVVWTEDQDRNAKIAFQGIVSKYEFKKIGLILSIDPEKKVCLSARSTNCSRVLYLNGYTYQPVRNFPNYNNPRDLVASLYKKLDNPISAFDRDLFDKVFTKDIVALLVLHRALAQSVSSEIFETPWFSGQDGEPTDIQIDTKKTSGADALVQASYRNSMFEKGHLEQVDFYLRQTSDGWRIADVKWPIEDGGNKKSYKARLNESLINDALGD